MSGLKPEREEADRLIEKWSAQHQLRLEIFLPVLPGVIGLFLVVDGLPNGAYLEVGAGLLLLAATPFLARRLVRKSDFRHFDD